MLCMSQILQTLFILGLDFLKDNGFTLDFNKNELHVPYTKKSLYSKLNTGQNLFDSFDASEPFQKTIPVRICNVTENPRVFQKGEVLATCSPVTCVCKKFESFCPIQLASTVDSRPSRKC
ncbi:hypothetical protein TNCV_2264121 [Trichonephila clavipes]|nr:hypothetical protein TNCV_2264121 [Trichonephila clavipes]